MSATEFRPGDIAIVDGKPAVCTVVYRGTPWFRVFTSSGSSYEAAVTVAHEVGPVIGNVADIADGNAVDLGWQAAHAATIQIQQLQRWKEEAMPVMDGLQELGKALRIRPGERITGPAALEAVQKLRGAAQAFLDAYDNVGVEVWWPEESETLREALNTP